MRVFLTLWLLAAAGAAAAQETKKEPPPETKTEQERPAPRLNLKLENPGQYARETPPETGKADPLPSLGGDARVVTPVPTAPSTRPFPKDTERGE